MKCIAKKIYGILGLKALTNKAISVNMTEFMKALKDSINETIEDKSFNIKDLSIDDKKTIINLLEKAFRPFLKGPFSTNLYTELMLLLNDKPVVLEVSSDDGSTDDQLLNDTYKDEFNEDLFMDEAYKGSPSAKEYAEAKANEIISLSFLFLVDKLGRKVPIYDPNILGENIQKILKGLLVKICKYLYSYFKTNPNVFNVYIEEYIQHKVRRPKRFENDDEGFKKYVQNNIVSKLMSPEIYRKDRRNTFEHISIYFEDIFKTPANLDYLLDNARSSNPNKKDLEFFEAYNAFVILKNFDSLAIKKFGKLIEINEDSRMFAKDRYNLKQEGSNVYTTWRTTDEIWLNKEINNIVLILVTSIPKYNHKGVLAKGKYLKFNEFCYAISKLKSSIRGIDTPRSIKYFEDLKPNLSQLAQLFINDLNIKSFKQLVNISRLYPESAWEVIFEIASNSKKNLLNNLTNSDKLFSGEDVGIYHTIYKELIGGENSFYVDTDIALSDYNYRCFIVQAIDSIFKTNYIQYYTDKNGEILIRLLKDMAFDRFTGFEERRIDNKLANVIYQKFKETYRILDLDKSGKNLLVTFEVNGKKIVYDVKQNSVDLEGVSLTAEIVKDVLGININSQEFINGWNYVNSSSYTSGLAIVNNNDNFKKLVLTAIARTAVNNELLVEKDGSKYKSKTKLKGKVKALFGNNAKITDSSRGLSIIDGESELSIIKTLGRIDEFNLGLATSSQLKSGNGTSVSANTLSRLGEGYEHQWHVQNSKADSSTKHFILLNNPAFLGLFQTKELKDEDTILEAEDMTEGDMITSNFIFDFLGQFANEYQNIIYIIPQVISDKKFLGRLGINLNAQIKIDAYPEIKTWMDVINSDNYSEIMSEIIQNDFSLFFTKAKGNIKSDFWNAFKTLNKSHQKLILVNLINTGNYLTSLDLLKYKSGLYRTTTGKIYYISDEVLNDILKTDAKLLTELLFNDITIFDNLISPNFQEEVEIKEEAIRNGRYMLAPNGLPTKLSEREWLYVRTNEFKNWFGNWEYLAEIKLLEKELEFVYNNSLELQEIGSLEEYAQHIYSIMEDGFEPDPGLSWDIEGFRSLKENGLIEPINVSRVIDENGEPLKVYHTSSVEFDEFDLEYRNSKDPGYYGKGFYFYPRPGATLGLESPIIRSYFLNVRNPLVQLSGDFSMTGKDLPDGYDGSIIRYNDPDSETVEQDIDQLTALNPELILPTTSRRTEDSLELLNESVKKHNIEKPGEVIKLTDLVHYVQTKDGKLHNNPVLDTMLERFETVESTQKFFEERLLSTASSMLDKGFEFSLETPENSTTKNSTNIRVRANSKGWIDDLNELIIAKVTIPIVKSGKILSLTVNIRNREDVRSLLESFDYSRRKYKSEALIKRELLTEILGLTPAKIKNLEKKALKDIAEGEEYKLDGKVAGLLEELYIKNESKKDFTQLIELYKATHPQKYLVDEEGNPLSDDVIKLKIIRAPLYKKVEELVRVETILKIKDRQKTFKQFVNDNKDFLVEDEDGVIHKIEVEINPSIEKYIKLDYLFSEEWISSTVGHHFAHPNKKFTGELKTEEDKVQDEATRKEAQNKRNVSISATMHEFELDLLNGIPSVYNVAVFRDVKDILYNVKGEIDDGVKPYDGATFVDPFIVYLENKSLGGAKGGIIKKLFVHFYDERTGTGGIIKTAGFGCTNMLMRDSRRWLSMMKSMTDRVWRITEEGIPGYEINSLIKPEHANILTRFDGKKVNYPVIYFRGENGNLYARKIKEYNGDFTYTVDEWQVDEFGEEIKNTRIPDRKTGKINSNYMVWRLLGGHKSHELIGGKLVPSEKSILLTVKAINNIGIVKNPNNPKTNQRNVYQFMKHSDIHYIATEGAVKQGAGNINSKKHYDSGESVNYMNVRMLQAGILLDKEHSADGEDVSLMTQVVSACVARGYTFENGAKELYEALAKLAEIGLKDDIDAVTTNYFEKGDISKIRELVIKRYVESLMHEKNPNETAIMIASEIIEEINQGKTPDYSKAKIPFSDPAIYNLFVTKLGVVLTNAAIKIKIDGVLSVLCPSHDIFKIHGKKLLHEYISDELLERTQQVYDGEIPPINEFEYLGKEDLNLINSPHKILIGRTYNIIYKDGTRSRISVNTPFDYFKIKDRLNDIYRINEYIFEGRNLGHYNCLFTCGDTKYNIFDLDSVKKLFEARLKGESEEKIIELQKELLNDLSALHNKGIVIINNLKLQVTNIDEIIPYEVILPKYFQTSFGLSQHDNLSDINVDFFIKKQEEHLQPQIPDDAYDVCLRKANGNHIYIKHVDKPRVEQLTEKKVPISRRKGRIVRLDNKKDRNELYELESEKDKILQYRSDNGNTYEVIETSDIEFYVTSLEDTVSMTVANGSVYLDEIQKTINNSWDVSFNPLLKEYIQEFKESRITDLAEFNKLSKSGLFKSKGAIERRAKRMYASFQKALELVAARIPALSMQSFMPMKIVGFDNSGTNTAYVSTAQIWLQGSDFDIDTATFTRFDTGRNGQFIHWSRLANLDSIELLKASDELPFPTGKECDTQFKRVPLLAIDERCFKIEIRKGSQPLYVLDLSTPDKILSFVEIINHVNQYGLYSIVREQDGKYLRWDLKIYDLLKKQIDIHNLSLEKRNEKYKVSAIKNYMLTYMYKIIADPANLIQAQTPIDKATDVVKRPLKNDLLKDAVIAREAIPGDPTVKVTGIYKNQTGKKGVGICATALKSYFAAFLQGESVLGNKNSNKEDLKKLILGKKGISIKGKSYFSISNLLVKDIFGNEIEPISKEEAYEIIERLSKEDNNVTENEIRKVLSHVANAGIDGAVLLSAMLSQATDNAKEGSLGKLNAGTRTLGMYMYGIIIGMSFEDLSEIMMSESARVISSFVEGNAFNKNPGLGTVSSALSYLEEGVGLKLRNISSNYIETRNIFSVLHTLFNQLYDTRNSDDTDEVKKLKKKELDDKFNKYKKKLQEEFGDNTKKKFIYFINEHLKDSRLAERLYRIASKLSLDKRIIFGEESEESRLDKQRDLKDFKIIRHLYKIVSEYAYSKFIVESDKDNFIALKKLSAGAEELSTLGRLLKLNQGLPMNDDLITFILNFESLISQESLSKINSEIKKQAKEQGTEPLLLEFTLSNFIKNPKPFIELYESKKVAFNILDVLDKTPHFKSYLTALMYYDEELKATSAKYRIIRLGSKEAANKLNIKSIDEKTKLNKRLRLMVDDYVQSEFLIETGFTFKVKKGQLYYDLNGTLLTAESDVRVSLGTYSGRATFKLWMEQVVIPDLLKGLNGTGSSPNTLLLVNKFILDIGTNGYNRTPNYVETTGYTLPINMSPRSEEERSILHDYQSHFKLLSRSIDGNDSHSKYYVGADSYSIIDLFFIYNLVVYLNQSGEGTLKNIFSGLENFGIIKDFINFESDFDGSNILFGDIPKEYWKMWATPVGGVFNTNASLIFTKDDKVFGRALYVKGEDESVNDPNAPLPEEGGENSSNNKTNRNGQNYRLSGTNVYDLNFIGFKSEAKETIDIEGKKVKLIINHGKIIAIQYDKKELYLDEPIIAKKVTIVDESNSGEGANITDLKIKINNIINKC